MVGVEPKPQLSAGLAAQPHAVAANPRNINQRIACQSVIRVLIHLNRRSTPRPNSSANLPNINGRIFRSNLSFRRSIANPH